MVEKKIGTKKNYNKNFNQKELWTFQWLDLSLIFKSPNLGHFLLDWYFFHFNMYNSLYKKKVAFHMDLIN
jgi:hypothetical protein